LATFDVSAGRDEPWGHRVDLGIGQDRLFMGLRQSLRLEKSRMIGLPPEMVAHLRWGG
jgi:hypothetical protein